MPRPRRTREYFGQIINYNPEPGYALRWTSLALGGKLSADTLGGIKTLIRERRKSQHPH